MANIKVKQIPINSIIIADDSKQVVTLHSKFARTACPEISILAAYDGTTAWDEFQKSPTAVAMLDIEMPGMNGVELAEKIYRYSPSTGIIVFSGKLNQQIMLKFASIEVDFSKKPASEFDVATKIRAALRRFEKDLMIAKMTSCARVTVDLNTRQFDLPTIEFFRELAADRQCSGKIELVKKFLEMDIKEQSDFQKLLNDPDRKRILDLLRNINQLKDPGALKVISDIAYSRDIDFS